MEYSQFDDFIKSNTKDELSAPEELSWDNMNFSLPPAKRKRRILPWLLLLLLGVGLTISLIGYTYYQNSNGIGSNSLGNSVSIERQNRGVDAEAGYSDQCEEPFRAITTDDVSTDFETESSPSTRTVHYTRTMSGNRKQQTTVSGGTQYKDTPTPAPDLGT